MLHKNIAVIGCGNIGSRILQSIARIDGEKFGPLSVYGVEPYESAAAISKQRFAQENKFDHQLNIGGDYTHMPPQTDLLIVSCDARNRLAALKTALASTTPRAVVLEKILFTRAEEFSEAEKLIAQAGAECWVNCSRNVWPGYTKLRADFAGRGPLSYHVNGADWSMGSNAIHFLAAFEYLTGQAADQMTFTPAENPIRDAKRSGYKEICGRIEAKTERGDHCVLVSNARIDHPMRVEIGAQGLDIHLDEIGQTIVSNGGDPVPFAALFTSQLEHAFADILVNGRSDLPTYQQSQALHLRMFGALAPTFTAHGIAGESPIT